MPHHHARVLHNVTDLVARLSFYLKHGLKVFISTTDEGLSFSSSMVDDHAIPPHIARERKLRDHGGVSWSASVYDLQRSYGDGITNI
jgi:hypothetical protein